jgi:hypothetical protein
MTWHKCVPQIFRSRYTRALEDEAARLRNENRALINSILSIAGLPPMRLEAEVAREKHRVEIEVEARQNAAAPHSTATGAARNGRAGKPAPHDPSLDEPRANRNASSPPIGQENVLPANPHRRRSWQQISRILELEESRQISNRDNSDSMKPRVPEL